MFIESSGSIVDRVDHYGSDTYNVRGLFDAFEGIEQEGLSEAFPLFADIDCQASEEDDSDWMIRQSPGDSLRAFMLVNRPGTRFCRQAT
jgi:hypothetical protein